MASMQKAMCSSSGTPSNCAPFVTSSRLTPRAKALSFIRFFTELASKSRMLFEGRVSARSYEASEFIAGEKGFFQQRISGDAGVIGVGKDRANDFLGVSLFAQDFGAFGRVSAVGGVFMIGPAFVIEIVEESGEAPCVFIGAILSGIRADAGFNSQHVFA